MSSDAHTQSTIVDPSQAPVGREPLFLGVDWIEPNDLYGKQRYRTEAWRTTRGALIVIVSDNGGTSLMNASEKIAAAVDKRWSQGGELAEIIEDWSAERPFLEKHRFVRSDRKGGNWVVDFDELGRYGIRLPT